MRVSQRIPNGDVHDLEQEYANALEEYLSIGGEDGLRSAYEIGRAALADGRGVHDMAAMHHAVVARLLEGMSPSASLIHDIARAQEFFDAPGGSGHVPSQKKPTQVRQPGCFPCSSAV